MHQSLYRKYRPQTFDDVVGQSHIEQTLRNAVAYGTVAHAYLFCGPRGTGKTTTARLLAKALLCEKGPTANPCGVCERCLEIAGGTHTDVYELDAASRTGVDNVREEIISRVQFSPVQGAYKIYIIDEVHMLSVAAFNALLKTLEEPPAHVVFVLCTTDPQKVPATILSRCQRYDFHRLTAPEIAGHLKHICVEEGFAFDDEAIALIAAQAQGGMRDAITALEQVAVYGGGCVRIADARNMLGELADRQLFEAAGLIAARDLPGCLRWLGTFYDGGSDSAQLVRSLCLHFRDLLIVRLTGGEDGLVAADAARLSQLKEQAASFEGPDRLTRIIEVLSALSAELRTAPSARLAIELAFAKLARPEADLTLASLAERVEALEAGGLAQAFARPAAVAAPAATMAQPVAAETAAQAAPAEKVEAAKPAAQAAAVEPAAQAEPAQTPASAQDDVAIDVDAILADPMAIQRLWNAVSKDVKHQRPAFANLFGGSRAKRAGTGHGLVIELPPDAGFAAKMLDQPETKELIASVVRRVYGAPLSLAFVLSGSKEAARLESATPAGDASASTAAAVSTPRTLSSAANPTASRMRGGAHLGGGSALRTGSTTDISSGAAAQKAAAASAPAVDVSDPGWDDEDLPMFSTMPSRSYDDDVDITPKPASVDQIQQMLGKAFGANIVFEQD